MVEQQCCNWKRNSLFCGLVIRNSFFRLLFQDFIWIASLLLFLFQANYTDPQSKLRFSTMEEFAYIRMLPSDVVTGYLALRKATSIVSWKDPNVVHCLWTVLVLRIMMETDCRTEVPYDYAWIFYIWKKLMIHGFQGHLDFILVSADIC